MLRLEIDPFLSDKINGDTIKFLFVSLFTFIIFSAHAQYYRPADTINTQVKVIPPPDSIFKSNEDTTRILPEDALRHFQDSLFRAAYKKNQNPNQKTAQTINSPKGKHSKIDTTHYSAKKAALWALACPGL